MPDPYRCAICGDYNVVPGLSRDCEAKHQREADQWANATQQPETDTAQP